MQEITAMNVRTIEERTAVVDIAGDLTAAQEAALMEAYAGASASRDVRAVVLNFTELEYMNSTGIGLLVTLLVRANRQDVRLFACGLSDHYRQILELTRLDEAISVFDSEADAVAAARST